MAGCWVKPPRVARAWADLAVREGRASNWPIGAVVLLPSSGVLCERQTPKRNSREGMLLSDRFNHAFKTAPMAAVAWLAAADQAIERPVGCMRSRQQPNRTQLKKEDG